MLVRSGLRHQVQLLDRFFDHNNRPEADVSAPRKTVQAGFRAKKTFKGKTAMKHVIEAVFVIALSCPVYCFAVSPVSVVKGPPASLKMEVHKFGVHEIYLTRSARAISDVQGPMKITLSRGSYPNIFQVDISYKELSSGQIYFRVDVPLEEESNFQIRAVEMATGSIWYEVFSGKISEIPSVFQ